MFPKSIIRRLLTGPNAIREASKTVDKAQFYENICLYFCMPSIFVLSILNFYLTKQKQKEEKPETIPYSYLKSKI